MSARGLIDRERLVHEHTMLRNRVDERRHQRTVQIVKDDHRVVTAPAEMRRAGLQIERFTRQISTGRRIRRDRVEDAAIAIDSVYAPASGGEKECVPATTGPLERIRERGRPAR